MRKDFPTSTVPVLQFLSDFTSPFRTDVEKSRYSASNSRNNLRKISGKDHIRVLLYSGEFDMNCNTLGTLHTLEANKWRNKYWEEADRSLWVYGKDVAGEYFTMDEGVFSFLIVRNSGHLLPMDLPEASLEMLRKFISGESFADKILPREVSYKPRYSTGQSSGVLIFERSSTGKEKDEEEDAWFNGAVTGATLVILFLCFAFLTGIFFQKFIKTSRKRESVHYSVIIDEEPSNVKNSIVSRGFLQPAARNSFDSAGYQSL